MSQKCFKTGFRAASCCCGSVIGKQSKYNGEKEIVMYQDNKPTGKAIYYFLNGDREIYNYYNGKIEGEAQYIYFNGYRERYKY